VLIGTLAALLAVGCGGQVQSAQGPSETLRAYATAWSQGRADDAYRLLSNDAKRQVSLEAFRRMVRENPDEARDIARALSRPASPPVVTATVTSPGGEVLELVFEDGRWTIDGTGIDRYGQATPRQAIEGFVRAFERGRYDVLMRYVPEAEREGRADVMWGEQGAGGGAATSDALTAEALKKAWTGEQKSYITTIVQAIKSALDTARIEQTEDHAAMPYGAGGTVLLVREGGKWKIEDLK